MIQCSRARRTRKSSRKSSRIHPTGDFHVRLRVLPARSCNHVSGVVITRGDMIVKRFPDDRQIFKNHNVDPVLFSRL